MWEMNHCEHWILSSTTHVPSVVDLTVDAQELIMCEMNHCEHWIISSTANVLSVVDLPGDAQGIGYLGNESLDALDPHQRSSCSLSG